MKKHFGIFAVAGIAVSLALGFILIDQEESMPVQSYVSDINNLSLSLSSYDDVVSGARTEGGNEIEFAHSSLASSSGVGTLSESGYIYNATKISGISSVEVSLNSGGISIYYGASSSEEWEYFTDSTTADFSAIRPNYFKIEAKEETVISSITVHYYCIDYQQEALNSGYKVYVNDLLSNAALVDATKQNEGYIKQYKMTLDVYAGDVVSFTKNGASIYPSPSGGDNNLYSDDSRRYLIVSSSCRNADLYLKIYQNSYEVWLSGYGYSIEESRLGDGTILQAWNWSIPIIMSHLDDIADAGYGAIQISPLQIRNSISDSGSWTNEWWKFYQPHSLSASLNSGDNILGTRAQLSGLCVAAKEKGIGIIVDVVLNHLAGSSYSSFDHAVSSYEPVIYDNNGSTYRHDYGTKSDDSQLQTIRYSLGNYPDLKTEDPFVMSRGLALLQDYLDCGVAGFRFDAAKHIETPRDGQYASSFWPYVINGAKRYAYKKGYDMPYCYGEALGAGDNRSLQWYTPYMSITEGSNAYNLRDGVNGGDISKISGDYYSGLGADKLVLWAESHDNYKESYDANSVMSETNINKVYAIQASRSEATALYMARPYDSNTSIGSVGSTAYKGSVVAAVNKLHKLFAGTGEYITVNGSDKYFVNVRGNGDEKGAVIVNIAHSGTSFSVNMPTLNNGSYKDLVTGNEYNVTSGNATLTFTDGVCVLVPTKSSEFYLFGNGVFTGSQSSWTLETARLMQKGSDNLAYIENIRIEAGAKVQIVRVYSDDTYSWISANLGASYNFAKVSGNDLEFTLGGTYSIYLNNSGVYYLSGTPDAEEATNAYTYTATGLPNWIGDDNCVIFVWAWGGSDAGTGKWFSVTMISGTSLTFETSDEIKGFNMARCVSGTTAPNWSQQGNSAGRIYNKSENIDVTSGIYSYASSAWVEYNP